MEFLVRPEGRGAILDWGEGARRCAIGRAGIAHKRNEGDGITPIGSWPLRSVLYRADRLAAPVSVLAMRPLTPDDGWCDDPGDPNYNRLVALPYRARHEKLWRQDALYDIVVVLGFNDAPVVAGRGSAIFLHVAGEDHAATEGCIALALSDLVAVLAIATTASFVRIVN